MTATDLYKLLGDIEFSLRHMAKSGCGGFDQGRRHIVFGEGDPHAGLVFVGEGPGFDEDQQGRPFVGAAGKLLTRMIEAMGLTRESVYICNVVKCRPPDNRTPCCR